MRALIDLLTGPDAWLPAIIVAPFIGSFLGVLVTRLPVGAPVIRGRSRCDRCGHRLGPAELVPLFSYAASRGRCRRCHGPISLRLPAIELAATGVAVWAATLATGGDLWLSCVLGWWLLVAGWIDQETMLLPDSLTLPLLVAGLAAAATLDPDSLTDRLLAAALGYLLLFGTARLYRALRGREGLGLGDAKLLAALGAWLGLATLPLVLLLAALVGLCIALGLHLAGRRVSAQTAIPFGPCLALAGWLAWAYGEPISAWLGLA